MIGCLQIFASAPIDIMEEGLRAAFLARADEI